MEREKEVEIAPAKPVVIPRRRIYPDPETTPIPRPKNAGDR
jgi:hypothetical protein